MVAAKEMADELASLERAFDRERDSGRYYRKKFDALIRRAAREGVEGVGELIDETMVRCTCGHPPYCRCHQQLADTRGAPCGKGRHPFHDRDMKRTIERLQKEARTRDAATRRRGLRAKKVPRG